MTRAQLSARLLAPLAWLLRKCGWLCVEPIEPYRSKGMFDDVRICPETGAPIVYVDADRMHLFGPSQRALKGRNKLTN